MATPGPYPKGTMSVFTKIDLTPFSYGPGETRNSNIFYGNYVETILRLVMNNFIYDNFR